VAQFDAYDNPTVAQREGFPYLVVLQSDQLDQVSTRFVMPLARAKAPAGSMPRRLAGVVEVLGEPLHLAAHLCATVPSRVLKKPVASLRSQAPTIIDALDAVVSGV
jgi:toxin CcdB